VIVALMASLGLNVNLLTENRAGPATSASPAKRPPSPSKRAPAKSKTAPRSGVSAAERRLVRPKERRRAPKAQPRAAHASTVALRWPSAPSAAQYDLVIWRAHRRVLDVWSRDTQVDLVNLSCADARKLRAGFRYLWFVYPLLDRRGPHRFGPLLKWGVFRAGRPASCQ
jgi:hypothetical protein